jgi:uncharacterized protein YqjF (DUF2071 family)
MALSRPMFRADWCGALFMRFEVDRSALQRAIPFELDLYEGRAIVSLVAFTQKRLRPAIGGKIAALLSVPLAEHEFLNLRAYVRVGNERGIYFLSEWISNRLAVVIGPRLYGLPYRLGALRYEHMLNGKPVRGRVAAPGGQIVYRALIPPNTKFGTARVGTLDHFLLERYVAFTNRNGIARRFEVDHAPWPQTRVDLDRVESGLLSSTAHWARTAKLIAANFSPGVFDVGISRPSRLKIECHAT